MENKPNFNNRIHQFNLISFCQKIDSNWKFENTDISYMFEILKLLDAVNIEGIPDLQQNAKVCQRLLHRVRIMKQINPSWSLDVESIIKFLYPTLNIQLREEQTPLREQIQFQ